MIAASRRRIGLAALGAFLACPALAAPVDAPPARLEVAWISREPALAPPADLHAPREAGWPEVGSRVQWVAHVLNRGTETATGVAYAWSLDGNTALTGTVDLPPGETLLLFPWDWTFERHRVGLEIRPPPAFADVSPDDDRLTVVSDALSLGIWIQRGVYEWMAEDGRPGFERWIDGQIDGWNLILARSVYPTAPLGVLDRIRLDRVVVLSDDQQPRNAELTNDLVWFFPTVSDDPRFLGKNAPASTLANENIVLHELLHERGLIDLYAYEVLHGWGSGDGSALADSKVSITENGTLVAGTDLMPALASTSAGIVLFRSPFNGLMGSQYRGTVRLTEHSADGLNLRAGRRTPRWLDQWGNLLDGFANLPQPDNYANLMPSRTDVFLVDQSGAPIAGAAVGAYLDHSRFAYQKLYTAAPDRTFSSDSRGVVTLPGDLLEGLPSGAAPPKAQVMILGVRTDRARGYAFVPLHDFNLAYFREGPDHGSLRVEVSLHRW